MSLADLIQQRDNEAAEKKKHVDELSANVKELLTDIAAWEQRNRWRLEDYPEDGGYQCSFLWLGMRFWPKLLGEQHEQYVKGFHYLYMLTLNLEQAEALRISVFKGAATGAVKSNWTYEWQTNYREDGWVELLVGRH